MLLEFFSSSFFFYVPATRGGKRARECTLGSPVKWITKFFYGFDVTLVDDDSDVVFVAACLVLNLSRVLAICRSVMDNQRYVVGTFMYLVPGCCLGALPLASSILRSRAGC